ncbi:hypothetical protein [Streptomyces sp. NBC_00829]|uniref:hypothetical protein n=1 Tax=Streptomyces sp. NBC_00829 TaxID=2903679 RepID=UPI00386F6223|nr:hypothetical protein OG293_23195 [Streptomyces sp. NBC_00829]
MRTRTLLTATSVALLTLTGCSSNTSDDPKADKPGTSASPTPSDSATPTPAAPLTFGQPTNADDREAGTAANVTVLGYEQGKVKTHASADEEFGTTGYVWATVDLKVCSTKGTVGMTRNPWELAYSDGTRIRPSSATYGDFPKPEYPYEAQVKVGDCVRGKTVFAVPAKQRPERVIYTSEAVPVQPEWSVPKA